VVKTNRLFSRLKRKASPLLDRLPRLWPYILISLIALLLIFIIPRLFNLLKNPSRTALSFIQNPEQILKNTQGRTNVVLLGKGGAIHETPDLTDTIIFISHHHPSGETIMLSLPRDIWVDSLRARLNTAYYYGNLKKPGGGLILAKASVEEIIDQPIHYIAVLDFQGFINIIDILGGIEINVKTAFDDYKYPIPGKETATNINDRYLHLHFDQGSQIMDGDRALKFVRSRNAQGDEGTDYARAARQQQVITALIKKAISSKVLLKSGTINQLLKTISNSLDTDIKGTALTGFIKLALKFDSSKITSIALDQGDKETGRKGYLVKGDSQDFDGQWVLTGKNNSWDEVQVYVKDLLEKEN